MVNDSAIEVTQEEASIDVRGDPTRIIFDQGRPVLMQGMEITFFVQFYGDGNLFEFRPNSYTLNPPCARVHQGELVLTYVRLDHNVDAVKRDLQSDLASIKSYLETQRSQVKQYNETLKSKIQQRVTERKDKLLKSQGMVAALGYPLRRRGDAPETYVVPTARRKPAVVRAVTKPFAPEPVLDMAEYEHILGVISSMVHVMERSPTLFRA